MKRLMSLRSDDATFQEDRMTRPIQVVEGRDHKEIIKVEYLGDEFTLHPENVAAMLLKEMKEIAEKHTQQDQLTDCVITVPAYYNDLQR